MKLEVRPLLRVVVLGFVAFFALFAFVLSRPGRDSLLHGLRLLARLSNALGPPPDTMSPPEGFTATGLALGSNHLCALRSDGTVWCWGRDNTAGQLGDGSKVVHHDPRPVPGLRDVIGVASGDDHTCAVLHAGEVRCWGRNEDGQLGDGTRVNRETPVSVLGLPRARTIHAGNSTTCAEVDEGGLWCWGTAFGFRSHTVTEARRIEGLETPLVGLSIGYHNACAIARGGDLFCWGDDTLGQLGDGTSESRSAPTQAPDLKGVRAVTTGLSYSCALVGNELQCWGFFPYPGQSPSCGERRCTLAPGEDLVSIVAGDRMLCAVDRAGSTSCFGANDDRAILTNGSTTPTWLPPRLQAVRLSGPAATLALDGSLDGYGTGCVLTRDGTISCFTIERRAPD